jgi:hypothetical protein
VWPAIRADEKHGCLIDTATGLLINRLEARI